MISSFIKNKTVRNGTVFSLFSFLNQGIGFFILLVMGRYIMPDSYGKLSLFTTVVQLLSIFICLGTNGIIGVDFFRESKEHIQRLVNVVIISALFVYGLLLSLILVVPQHLAIIVGIDDIYLFYAVSVCLFQIVSSIILNIWQLEEKVFVYGVFSSLTALANLALTFVFVACLHWDWQGRVFANVIASLVFFILAIYFLVHKKYLVFILPSVNQFKEALKFGVPLIPHSMSFWMRQGMDRYVINMFLNHSAVGIFSFASNFGNIIQMVGFAFNSSNSVHIYKLLSSHDENKVSALKKECHYLLLLYTGIGLVVYVIAYFAISILFTKYLEAIKYLLPLCIGGVLQCFYLIYVNILFYYKETKNLMLITFGSSLFHVALSLWLTRYGLFYTSIVMAISNSIIFCGVYFYSKRVLCKYNTKM